MMSEVPSVYNAVKKFFRDSHLSCKQDWLESCLEYFSTSNPQANFQSCKDFALEQWKLGNLREIGVPTFPTSNLKIVKKTELKGTFAVQVEKFWDKANSAYNQYKNYKGELGDQPVNEEANEDGIDLTEWGKGPSAGETKRSLKPRRLLLDICDGTTELKALEWKPIQELSGMVYPGAKMVITGPVICRNGILMLGPQHVKLYGGEVDDIIYTNAMENLVCDSLNMPINNDPYTGKTNTLPPPRKPCTQPKKTSQFQPKQQQSSFSRQENPISSNPPNPPNRQSNNAQKTPLPRAPTTSTNFFNNPSSAKQPQFSSPKLRMAAKKPAITPVDPVWDDELDDFELSAEDLQHIKSAEKKSQETRKRQTSNPVETMLVEDDLDEILRLEEEASKAKRAHFDLPKPHPAQPVLARVKPIVKNPVQASLPPPEKVSLQPKAPNLKNFLSRPSVAKKEPPKPLPSKVKIIKRPFLYLIQLQDKWRKRATVKATIISLLQKVQKTNQRWSLNVRITDGTAFLDVVLGNRVLRKLIGVKCKNFSGLTIDKETKIQMLKSLQSKLIDCDCLMVLKFRNNSLPRVTKLKKATLTHFEQLKRRQRVLEAL
ncbi:recQ-mediated genome instability protein 1-like isoform X2 [Cloeon dipterum]|uniref:recQ-mediated genome instability protein 1-like isoform X2 n=1 Tax=Cloeon dipterum TaxID=197152 RepID=UPI00322079C8